MMNKSVHHDQKNFLYGFAAIAVSYINEFQIAEYFLQHFVFRLKGDGMYAIIVTALLNPASFIMSFIVTLFSPFSRKSFFAVSITSFFFPP
jgi:hypothetical protein